jgi:hypothetical protein
METTKNNLPSNVKQFFYKLSDYLDTKLLYYGSVQRSDYIPGKSDIDVVIFAENEDSIISKMQHFLHVNKKDFKKILWILDGNKVDGYKLQYKNPDEKIVAEFTIYNDQFKNAVLKEQMRRLELPFFISIILYIVKLCYYQLHLMSQKTYSSCKNFVLHKLRGEPDDIFFILK